jgi:Zn-finger protein
LLSTRLVVQPARNLDPPATKDSLPVDSHLIGDSFWSDGMVRVTGREYNGLIGSPCFKDARESDRTLSCSSCHSMHRAVDDPRPLEQWTNDQLAYGMDGNDACLSCHKPLRKNLEAHTKHAVGSEGSSCYNCHMPYTTFGLLKTVRSHQISSPSAAESLQAGRPNACNLCHLDQTLAWTADWLQAWYRTPKPAITTDEGSIAASLLWLLRGDAGQRAIVAQAMGWRPAQEASGAGWMAPHLAQLLKDPYAAVRFVASRSLRALPGFSSHQYDFLTSPAEQQASERRALETWRLTRSSAKPRAEARLLFEPDGSPMAEVVNRLLRERNNRPVHLRE